VKEKNLGDKDLGKLSRRWHDLVNQLEAGTVSYDAALACLNGVIEGKGDPMLDAYRRLINCDAPPSTSEDSKIYEADQPANRVRGMIYFNPKKIVLHPLNHPTSAPLGAPLGAVVLEHLMVNRNLIPHDDWFNPKGHRINQYIVFLGDVYRVSKTEFSPERVVFRSMTFSYQSYSYRTHDVETDYANPGREYMAAYLTP